MPLQRLLKPELPVYGIGLLASAIIVGVIFVVVWATFQKGLPAIVAKLSLDNYLEVFRDPLTAKAGLNTLVLGLGTVSVSLFFAVPIAWLIHRTNIPSKSFFLTVIFLTILIPSFLSGMGWIMLLSPKIGLINKLLRILIPVRQGPLSIYNIQSIAILQGLTLTPVMFFMISGALQAIDPSFEEAAEVAGAPRFKTLFRVTFPLVLPSIVAAAIYNFMIGVSMFELVALLGASGNIQVFSTLMFYAVQTQVGLPNYGIAAVYGVTLLVPMLFALYFYQKMLRLGYRYATVTGKGYRPKLIDLGSKGKWAGVSFICLFLVLDMGLPLLAMAWTSIMPYLQLPSRASLRTATIAGYKSAIGLLLGGGAANTLILILSVGILVVLVSTAISWIVLRTRMPGRYAMDSIAMLPHGMPRVGIAFGIAFVGLLVFRVIPIYGSVAIIVFADALSLIAFGTRLVNGGLIQIHRDLEEAVEICGGSRAIALRRVILPILLPTMLYTLVYSALISYREVTMALFLQSPRNMVLSTLIWQRWMSGDSTTAAALGVIMVGVMGTIIFMLLWGFPRVFGLRGVE